ncbi:hypothetical protein CHS0354_041210 [Potamilus streckersoni]|uniref:Uncharacterized protein n=1 Tax=Potamilus streckersoni TaxID=2493646 RepID=A0AAE0SDX6_9BIVA|nr:hypothetical protein CHS0354_041210 [Potamilus streckersoni]
MQVKQELITSAQTCSLKPYARRTRKALQSKTIPQEKKSSIREDSLVRDDVTLSVDTVGLKTREPVLKLPPKVPIVTDHTY